MQVLNIKAYLIFIGLKPDKKTNYTATRLCLSLFYLIITQKKLVHLRPLLISLEIIEKCHIRLLKSSIFKLEKRLAYITIL